MVSTKHLDWRWDKLEVDLVKIWKRLEKVSIEFCSDKRMLKKLDIYIIKKFLATFFFVVLIFTMIAVVIDFSEKVEEFIDEDLGAKQVVSEYYINFLWKKV